MSREVLWVLTLPMQQQMWVQRWGFTLFLQPPIPVGSPSQQGGFFPLGCRGAVGAGQHLAHALRRGQALSLPALLLTSDIPHGTHVSLESQAWPFGSAWVVHPPGHWGQERGRVNHPKAPQGGEILSGDVLHLVWLGVWGRSGRFSFLKSALDADWWHPSLHPCSGGGG